MSGRALAWLACSLVPAVGAASETARGYERAMPDCLLGFVRVSAGRDALGSVHIYYGDYFVGAISHSGGAWTPRLHDILLGRFDDLGSAVRVVCEWYYGSTAAVLPVRSLQAQRTDQDQK